MKYVVECLFGATIEAYEPSPDIHEVAEALQGVYETAALQGGRVIASHMMILGEPRSEHLFLVCELPESN